MKKLTKKQWSERGIHNPHNIAARSSGVLIYYRPRETGRASRCTAWQVVQIGKRTDPKAHWMDYGHKTFMVFSDSKEAVFEKAKAFALEKFGFAEWERDPWGSWHPIGDLETAAKA